MHSAKFVYATLVFGRMLLNAQSLLGDMVLCVKYKA